MQTYDWFTKFTRTWAAGFASLIVLPYLVGYVACFFAANGQQISRAPGFTLVLFSEFASGPGAIFTCVVAALCVTLSARLRTAVIACSAISFACLGLIFLLSPGAFF